jgi:Asp-tRNA(Asn)/Glu-tRNA(Gln) amidotransferase A subunit family amidase
MNDLHWLTAAELAGAYAARKVSPVELVQSLLERIDALEPQLNAFIKLDRDAVLAKRRKPSARYARAASAGRCMAYRSASKTSSTWQGRRRPAIRKFTCRTSRARTPKS